MCKDLGTPANRLVRTLRQDDVEVKRVTKGPSQKASSMATPVTRCGVTTGSEVRRGGAAQSDRRRVDKVRGRAWYQVLSQAMREGRRQ